MEPHLSEVENIAKKELRERLQRGEGVVIVDARGTHPFEASNIRPKGAVRIAPGAANGEIAQLPKDKQIVTVCT